MWLVLALFCLVIITKDLSFSKVISLVVKILIIPASNQATKRAVPIITTTNLTSGIPIKVVFTKLGHIMREIMKWV